MYGKGWNIINTKGELLLKGDKWLSSYSHIHYFYEGLLRCEIAGEGLNYINKQGELLWEEDNSFEYIGDFHEGFAAVKIAGKWNHINPQGELLWEEDNSFEYIGDFYNGFAPVRINN